MLFLNTFLLLYKFYSQFSLIYFIILIQRVFKKASDEFVLLSTTSMLVFWAEVFSWEVCKCMQRQKNITSIVVTALSLSLIPSVHKTTFHSMQTVLETSKLYRLVLTWSTDFFTVILRSLVNFNDTNLLNFVHQKYSFSDSFNVTFCRSYRYTSRWQ